MFELRRRREVALGGPGELSITTEGPERDFVTGGAREATVRCTQAPSIRRGSR
jgi:hypothetical protein